MVEEYHYYNVFSPEGKLLQIEHALVALNKSPPIIILKNSSAIVTVTKSQKKDVLADIEALPIDTHYFRVNQQTGCLITGLAADTDILQYSMTNLSVDKENIFNFTPDAQIISRAFSYKIQKNMQQSGKRPLSFGAVIFDNYYPSGPNIFYVDTSAVCLPYKSVAIGENSLKANKFLEKNYRSDCTVEELLELGLEAMAEAIGNDYCYSDVVVGIMESKQPMQYLSHEKVDSLLVGIAEKR